MATKISNPTGSTADINPESSHIPPVTGDQILYDPNQLLTHRLEVPLPAGWSINGNEKVSAEVVTCQANQIQAFVAAAGRKSQHTETFSSAGIHDGTVSEGGAHIINQQGEVTYSGITLTPSITTTPGSSEGIAAEETGMATSIEDKITEVIEQSISRLKDVLSGLDLKIIIKRTEEGTTEFHIFNGGNSGVGTSEEKELHCEILPESNVEVNGPKMQYSNETMAHQTLETGGGPLTIAAFGPTGIPTDMTGSAAMNISAKNIADQIGFVNFVGAQVSFNTPILCFQFNT